MLLTKQSADRPAVTHFESVTRGADDTRPLDYLLPIMTQSFDVRHHYTLTPTWNETLLIDIEYTHVLKPRTLILFEILEFGRDLPLGRDITTKDGFQGIAWGFLKPVGQNGRANTEKDVCDSPTYISWVQHTHTHVRTDSRSIISVPGLVWPSERLPRTANTHSVVEAASYSRRARAESQGYGWASPSSLHAWHLSATSTAFF